MSAIAIIPARGGSRRIPRKNIRLFHGKPIIAYSIETANRSGVIDRVVVSTDDVEVADTAIAYGAWVLWRDKKFAQDDVGTQEVALQSVGLVDPDFVCCIYATAPLMSHYDILRGWEEVRRPEVDFAFAVGTNPLSDAGQFYWSRREALIARRDLIGPSTVMIPVARERVCDINVEDDWLRAEKMYAALQEKK